MQSFRSYIEEKVMPKAGVDTNLTVFDIDDTLFRTGGDIKVIKDGKVVKTLSPKEQGRYKLKKGEGFDYSDFRKSHVFAKTASPIDKMVEVARKILARTSEKDKTIVLTARGDMDDKKKFLQTFRKHGIDIDKAYIERAGNFGNKSSAAKNKKIIFNKYLSTGNFSSITFFDDSLQNITSFRSLAKRYPGVKFTAYHVQPDGSIKKS